MKPIELKTLILSVRNAIALLSTVAGVCDGPACAFVPICIGRCRPVYSRRKQILDPDHIPDDRAAEGPAQPGRHAPNRTYFPLLTTSSFTQAPFGTAANLLTTSGNASQGVA
jgi:hypothetical protein